jgi:hypothetical protein
MLVPARLTVKVTVKMFEAADSGVQINSVEGSLMIEWGARRPMGAVTSLATSGGGP